MTCVSSHALVSGLLLRIERDGHVPSPSELRALLALGEPREQLRRVLVERGGAHASTAFSCAVEVLDGIP